MPDSKYDKRERLPYLLENLPVGVYRTNPEGKIIKANQILIQMLGYQNISDLENLNVKDLYVKSTDRENHLKKLETAITSYANL